MAEIRLFKIRMRQHGDEHGRNAMEGGDMLVVDAGQGGFRAEIRDRKDRPAMRHRRRHSQHHPKAVEHGDLDHHSVRRREIHTVTDTFPVIHDIIMSQHDSLGEPCGSRSILHVADVVHIHSCCHTVNLLQRSPAGVFQRFFPSKGARHAEAYRDDVAKERKSPGVKRLARLIPCQFRAEFTDDLFIIRIPVAFDHHQSVGI